MLIDSFSCLFPVHYFLSYLTRLLSRLTHSFILRWGDSNPINLTAGTEDPVPTGLGLLLLTEKRKHWPNDSLIGSSERPCAPTATYLYLEWDCKQLGLFSFMLRNRVFHTIRPSPLSRFPMPPITYPYRSNVVVRYPRSTPSILNPSQPKARNRLNRVLKTWANINTNTWANLNLELESY